MRPRPLRCQVTTLAFVGILNLGCSQNTFDPTDPFTISSRRPDDSVKVTRDANKTIFSILSPFGISHLAIQRKGEEWPRPIVLRLRLSGLENLQVIGGETTLSASVSSQSEGPKVRLWLGKNDADSLDSKSPYWMDIRMVGSDQKPSNQIPLKNGYFEMQLPQAILDLNPKSIEVRWIDFYRG
jgi:hypothetical protein